MITYNKSVKYIYISMYRVLDCLYDEKPDNSLGKFLSDANPYLFADHSSADPVIEDEFIKYAAEYLNGQELTFENSYEMVVRYLENNTTFAERFKDIDLEEWTSLYEIVSKEEGKRTEVN